MTRRRRWWLLIGGLTLVCSALITARLGGHEPRDPGRCSDASLCFRSTAQNRFPDYGNTYPSNLSDCMFAAAANWQTIIVGTTPPEKQVEAEYLAAAASSSSGVDEDLFLWWWSTKGIGDLKISHWTLLSQISEERIKAEIRRHRAIFAVFTFRRGAAFGGTVIHNPGGHAAIIDGYTEKGPLVVTWGRTYQLSWGEYWQSINSIRAITR